MNPKINKLKAEREKNGKKIAALQQRNREIDDSIHELENLDIVGMVRSCGGKAAPLLARISTASCSGQQGRGLAAAARTAYRNGGI